MRMTTLLLRRVTGQAAGPTAGPAEVIAGVVAQTMGVVIVAATGAKQLLIAHILRLI